MAYKQPYNDDAALEWEAEEDEDECTCHTLVESRTIRLLWIPFVTAVTTTLMNLLNYRYYFQDEEDKCFVMSCVINFSQQEPWSAWLARWVLWFGTIFVAWSYKIDILASHLAWIPITTAVALCLAIISGYGQNNLGSSDQKYVDLPWGPVRLGIHSTCAIISFVLVTYETAVLWWPSKKAHCCGMGALVATLLLCGPYVALPACKVYNIAVPVMVTKAINSLFTIVEWLVLVVHLFVVWYRYPTVKWQIKNGTFKLWAPCCRGCCPNQPVLTGGNCCCPPEEDEYEEDYGDDELWGAS